ncbi:S1 RNA-binding domain-containing protein [Micromonospora echinospora]|uniref:S1 RNA-binding domain-containing protein n=1 Tax=Micromonospora echinospora TaxID=1877 RepID=UPI0033C5207D
MPSIEPTETSRAFLEAVQPGEVKTGTVAGFEREDVLVDLGGSVAPHRAVGRVPGHELSWRRVEDPAEIVDTGQAIEVEVIGVDWRREQVLLSARACEDRALRGFLVSLKRGKTVTGRVTDVRNFGVFVKLHGEPADICTGYSGTGFIRVPELSWSHFDDASEVVEVGQQVTVEVLDVDTRRGQVAVSLKALTEDPFIRLADRIGDVVSGYITKIVPIGVFVRVTEGIEGLLHKSDLPAESGDAPETLIEVGKAITVRIVEVDLHHHRVRLEPVRES